MVLSYEENEIKNINNLDVDAELKRLIDFKLFEQTVNGHYSKDGWISYYLKDIKNNGISEGTISTIGSEIKHTALESFIQFQSDNLGKKM